MRKLRTNVYRRLLWPPWAWVSGETTVSLYLLRALLLLFHLPLPVTFHESFQGCGGLSLYIKLNKKESLWPPLHPWREKASPLNGLPESILHWLTDQWPTYFFGLPWGPSFLGPWEIYFLSLLVSFYPVCKGCVCSVAQSCLTLFGPMDCSPLASSVHWIFQARILEWVAVSSSRGPSRPRTGTLCLLRCQVGSLPRAPPGKRQTVRPDHNRLQWTPHSKFYIVSTSYH